MRQTPMIVGRVLRASATSFALGCTQLIADQDEITPQFGALVKAPAKDGQTTYGLIANVTFEDDPFVRQLVAAGVEDEEIIADQRQHRQVPIIVDVLIVGYERSGDMHHRLPPQPPTTLSQIVGCDGSETARFTARHDWMRAVLASTECPADQLLPAALLVAAEARPLPERQPYLVDAGRELVRLLCADLPRLEAVLRQLR